MRVERVGGKILIFTIELRVNEAHCYSFEIADHFSFLPLSLFAIDFKASCSSTKNVIKTCYCSGAQKNGRFDSFECIYIARECQ